MTEVSQPNVRLISDYVDLVNANGRDSTLVREFIEKHADNQELQELIVGANKLFDDVRAESKVSFGTDPV